MNWQYEVLELVGGRPLEAGIANDAQDQIRQSYSDIKLDYLLTQPQDRASLVVLISKIPAMNEGEVNRTLAFLLDQLKLPILDWIWWIDEYTVTKGEYRIQMDFRERSKNILVVIKELLKVRPAMIKGYRSKILAAVGTYYTESPWCDLKAITISKEIISNISFDDEAIYELVQALKPKLRSLKQTKVSHAGYKKLSLNSGLKPKLGFSEIEDQRFKWKTENIDSISLFTLLLASLSGSRIKDHWWIISPTILNILDDHEGSIKLKGVELLSTLLSKIDDDFLKLTGLTDIFYDAISPLLTYLPNLTPTKQSVLIQQNTYPVLIQLFCKTPNCEERLIILLNSGIYTAINTVRDNFEVLIVLVSHMTNIVELLKVTTVKCLPRLLYTIGMIISDPFISLQQDLFEIVLQCLIVTILNGWPRVPNHKYDILGMIIMGYKKEEKSVKAETKLKVLAGILKRVCGDELQSEIDELTKNDDNLKGLFT